jgi:hypothetical protein
MHATVSGIREPKHQRWMQGNNFITYLFTVYSYTVQNYPSYCTTDRNEATNSSRYKIAPNVCITGQDTAVCPSSGRQSKSLFDAGS